MIAQREASAGSRVQPDPPDVSVIIVFLDAARWIAEAIESVRSQTFTGWELLLVDDGSSDGSTEICRDYCRREPGRIRYLAHPGHANRGISASRNLGLSVARGEYVAFLDADDVYLPDRLARHVEVLRDFPQVGAAQSQCDYWYSWQGSSQGTPLDVQEEPPLGDATGVVDGRTLLLLLVRTRSATATGICNLTVRSELLRSIGGFENAFRGLYEDQVLLAKLYVATSIYLLNECLARYRQHPWSTCAVAKAGFEDQNGRRHEPQHVFLEWLASFTAERMPYDRDIREAVDRWLAIYQRPRVLAELVRLRRMALRLIKNSLPVGLAGKLLPIWRRYCSARAAARMSAARRSVVDN